MIKILVFVIWVCAMLWLDLHGHKKARTVTLWDAAVWSIIWIAVSLAFAGYLCLVDGNNRAGLFIAGYLLEKSLSVDNLFVFMAIFASFGIKDATQHRVLYYGILGAIVFRMLFVGVGSVFLTVGSINPIVNMIVYSVFGTLVLYSAVVMLKISGANLSKEDFTGHWSVRLFRDKLHMPVWNRLSKDKFFVRVPRAFLRRKHGELTSRSKHKVLATPLLLCLIVVETSDIAFAFDSVPAVIAVTKDPFLVYTSNIFAILGLRSMYFLLVAAKKYLCHLEKAIGAILLFIAFKMFVEAFHESLSELLGFPVEIPVVTSLAVVVGGLIAGVVASVLFPET